EEPAEEPASISSAGAEAPLEPEETQPVEESEEPVSPLRSAISGEPAQDIPSHFDVEIDALAEIMLAGGRRVMVIAAAGGWEDSCLVAEKLGQRLIATGLSGIEIDAASGAPSTEPGLSEIGRASWRESGA